MPAADQVLLAKGLRLLPHDRMVTGTRRPLYAASGGGAEGPNGKEGGGFCE